MADVNIDSLTKWKIDSILKRALANLIINKIVCNLASFFSFRCSFLLDRLLQYEKVEDSSGDSDVTASSDSEAEGHTSGKK